MPWHPALTKFISDHMMVEVGDSKQGSKKYIHTQSEVRLMWRHRGCELRPNL